MALEAEEKSLDTFGKGLRISREGSRLVRSIAAQIDHACGYRDTYREKIEGEDTRLAACRPLLDYRDQIRYAVPSVPTRVLLPPAAVPVPHLEIDRLTLQIRKEVADFNYTVGDFEFERDDQFLDERKPYFTTVIFGLQVLAFAFGMGIYRRGHDLYRSMATTTASGKVTRKRRKVNG